MPMFSLKSPDVYPQYLHRALYTAEAAITERKPEHRQQIGPTWATKADALREQRRFNAFKMNVRRHPLHALNGSLDKFDVRCEIWAEGEAFKLVMVARSHVKSIAAVKAALGL